MLSLFRELGDIFTDEHTVEKCLDEDTVVGSYTIILHYVVVLFSFSDYFTCDFCMQQPYQLRIHVYNPHLEPVSRA